MPHALLSNMLRLQRPYGTTSGDEWPAAAGYASGVIGHSPVGRDRAQGEEVTKTPHEVEGPKPITKAEAKRVRYSVIFPRKNGQG
jgi:hypothetical protein